MMNPPSKLARLVIFTVAGAKVQIVMSEEAAREILDHWRSGWFRDKQIEHIGDYDCEGPWCIRLDHLSAMEIGQEIDVEAAKRAAAVQAGNYQVQPRDGRKFGGQQQVGSGLPPHLRPGVR